jgi:ATP-dependent exoDNAse (exonuclease V) beta subunit
MQQRNAATLEAPNLAIAEAKNSGLPKAENNRTGMVWANNPQTVKYNHSANIVVNLRIDNGKTRMQLTAPISGTIRPKKAPKFMFTDNSNRYKAYRRINFRYFLGMGFTYSEEQQVILDSKPGFNMVVANAGVGKTEISAEFIVQSYLKEQAKLFPGRGNVHGDDQNTILKQFKAISFTVKAAGELTHRVYRKFRTLGIPIPQAFGKEAPISKTCDAYLQRWLTHPITHQLWFKWDHRWLEGVRAGIAKLPPNVQKLIKEESAKVKGDFSMERVFQKHWTSLIDEKPRDALLYTICARYALLPEASKWEKQIQAAIQGQFSSTAASLPGHRDKWVSSLYQKLTTTTDKLTHDYIARQKHLEAAHLSVTEAAKLEADLRPWTKCVGLVREFGATYDLARSIGYHPFHAPLNAASKLLLDKIASYEYLISFSMFQRIAEDYENMKLSFCGLDFGDYMQSTKTTFEKFPYLLEKKKEYPAFGLRAKYLIWDEAQDNSLWQYWLLNLMCGAPSSNFHCIVLGDPKQAIYSFRGGNADEFVRNVKFLKDHAPNHLYGLTTSYRSCKKIVALGNEVAKMLPASKVEAMDSKGVYHEEGNIIVAPPLKDDAAEFKYVQEQYSHIRSNFGKDSSIMLLVRSGIEVHPCSEWVAKLKDPNIIILTQHRSKGLEADHVFQLGCTAGRFPDPRSTMDDEINLFYVACTRPRMALHICCPIILESATADEKATGPSPFVLLTPSLKIEAEKAGWTEEQLKKGHSAHKALVAMFGSKIKERKIALVEELKALYPTIPEANYTKRRAMDTGARWKRHYKEPDKMHIKPKALTDT